MEEGGFKVGGDDQSLDKSLDYREPSVAEVGRSMKKELTQRTGAGMFEREIRSCGGTAGCSLVEQVLPRFTAPYDV